MSQAASTGHTLVQATESSGRSSPRLAVMRYVRSLHRDGVVQVGELFPSDRAISRELGIHRATVRRALDILDEEGFLRTRKNGERILYGGEAMSRNALRSMVAVLMPDITAASAPGHTQLGWADLVGQGVIQALRQASQRVMILPPSDVDDTFLHQMRIASPAGLLVTENATSPVFERITKVADQLPCPVVAYGGHPRWAAVDRVISDHAAGSALLYHFLRSRGRQRILMVVNAPTSESAYWVDQRIAGYQRAAAESAASYRQIVRYKDERLGATEAEQFAASVVTNLGGLAEYLTGPDAADAVMCLTDGYVAAIATACRKLHRSPGQDIDIVGYDNYWRDLLFESQIEPYRPPATVDKQNLLMGTTMVALLRERISGKLDDSPQTRSVSPQLIVTEPNHTLSSAGETRRADFMSTASIAERKIGL